MTTVPRPENLRFDTFAVAYDNQLVRGSCFHETAYATVREITRNGGRERKVESQASTNAIFSTSGNFLTPLASAVATRIVIEHKCNDSVIATYGTRRLCVPLDPEDAHFRQLDRHAVNFAAQPFFPVSSLPARKVLAGCDNRVSCGSLQRGNSSELEDQ